ncbi:MAG: lipopolysaccharide biosynthesis protein [Henriciella sp.]|nr:lipopolysaccharide biosynthesis protein [Henriciella sp.]MBO6694295.1 lipopolysaccharide biosynthesis protein [Henriciella sp.]
MNQLAKKTATGAIINISVTLTKNLGQFLIVIPVLARILTPEQFGLLAMAMTLVGFLTMFNDLGISAALVRAEKPSTAFWSSAFWLNLGFGLTMTVAAYFAAPWVAIFFGEPQVEELVQVMSCILMLHCIFLVPMAWLQRNYKFRTIALIDLSAIALSSAAAIYLALTGHGVWALAWQQIILYAVKALAGQVFNKAPIRMTFQWSTIRAVLPFSLGLTGAAFVRFLNQNVDNVLIGRFFGADALGYYSRAYLMMRMPIQTLSRGLNFALYPAFSSIKEDTEKLGRAYVKTVSIMSVIVFPMMTGLALVVVPFVDLLFGPQWGPVAPVLRILAFVGLMQSVASSANEMWKARGRSGVLLRWSIIRAGGFIIAFAIGINIGTLEAMAWAFLIANIVLLVPFQYEVLNQLDVKAVTLLNAMRPQFISTLAMVAAVLSVQFSFPSIQALNSTLQLLILVPIGGLAYFLTLILLFRGFVRTSLDDFRMLRSKDVPTAPTTA